MNTKMPPDLLAIGHVTKDLIEDGHVVGGSATFAALTAQALGLSAAVVTSCADDVDPASAMPGIPLHIVPSPETTTFINAYQEGRRRQYLRGVGGKIRGEDIPVAWRDAPMVVLGPLTQELDESIVDSLTWGAVVASIQGWLRRWDESGAVSRTSWAGSTLLPQVSAAVFSDDDSPTDTEIAGWTEHCSVLVHTHGGDGCRVHTEGAWSHVPAFPANEVDPTGAGDVFATAFLIRFRESNDPLDAAVYASCAASFCVEAVGVEGIPTREQIEARLRQSRNS
ncbi:MAG: PfkB family carbohydrate kinase [SAR202 cluster bacterium]|nr:PfkB family carbohydrate kinase [SAR202 cluster bacterium]